MPFERAEWERATREAFECPQIGDRFQEMYAHWVYVVDRKPDRVTILSASAPCTFPRDAKMWSGSLEEFRQRYSSSAGYTVHLAGRGHSVEGWLESKLAAEVA
jgi:hypothetical protein